MLGCVAMIVVTTRAEVPRSSPVQLYAPAIPRSLPREQTTGEAPMYLHAGFRALEQERADAERRASAVEENFRAVQLRLKEALAHAKELEERLAMNDIQSSTNDGELQVLRDQLKETSERLHEAELDNNALRERMTLRQQELEEARRMAAEFRTQSASEDLRMRLQAADERASRMERQIDELEARLRHAGSMRLMHELPELDDQLEIAEIDDLDDASVVIRNTPGHTSEKVR
jgi:chromosome segregation ATPase